MVPWGPCVAASRSERAAGFVGGARRRSKEKGLALPSAGWIPGSSSKNPARSHLGRSRPGTSHSLRRSVLVVLRGLPACTACLPSCFLSPPYRILCKDRSFVCLVPRLPTPEECLVHGRSLWSERIVLWKADRRASEGQGSVPCHTDF